MVQQILENLFEDQDLNIKRNSEQELRAARKEAQRQERKHKAHTKRDMVLSLLERHPASSIIGCDEVGRGPLAGPVTAAAVVLDPSRPVHGLNDSKLLRASVRHALDPLIRSSALGWGLGWVWPEEIEQLNIHHASLLAMRRACAAMLGLPRDARQPQWIREHEPDSGEPGVLEIQWRPRLLLAVVDGSHIPDLSGLPWKGDTFSLVKGDALCPAISAASIIAKVARDTWMSRYAALDPRYGFENHMGYATPEHKTAIAQHGPCSIHRLSWLKL